MRSSCKGLFLQLPLMLIGLTRDTAKGKQTLEDGKKSTYLCSQVMIPFAQPGSVQQPQLFWLCPSPKASRHVADDQTAKDTQSHYLCCHSTQLNRKRRIKSKPTAVSGEHLNFSIYLICKQDLNSEKKKNNKLVWGRCSCPGQGENRRGF